MKTRLKSSGKHDLTFNWTFSVNVVHFLVMYFRNIVNSFNFSENKQSCNSLILLRVVFCYNLVVCYLSKCYCCCNTTNNVFNIPMFSCKEMFSAAILFSKSLHMHLRGLSKFDWFIFFSKIFAKRNSKLFRLIWRMFFAWNFFRKLN